MITDESPQALQTAAYLIEASQAAAEPFCPEDFPNYRHVIVPEGCKVADLSAAMEKTQPAPNRKSGTVQLKDIASLIAHCANQSAADKAYLYADPDARKITAVFNDNRGAALPGWRDHRAEFKAEYTLEFDNWMRNNKQPKEQTAFAEFIEDNFADIAAPDATRLLDIASTMQAKTSIDFKSSKRLADGQAQLSYVETIDAKAGAAGELTIPKEFTLALRVFKNGGGYKLKARLKYRLGSGAVKFWYELDRPERSVEDAFAGYITEVRDKTGYAVLIGSPG
jgi:uncharacterized protein YfdQ (DUF2303 family)